MTDTERDHRLNCYPDLLAGLMEALNLLARHRVILSILRDGFADGEYEATTRDLDDNMMIWQAAVDRATYRKGVAR